MDQQTRDVWTQLIETVSQQQNESALVLGIYLLLGGAMALYIRWMYRHCSASPSDADSIARVFPLLTLVTIGIIAVVKSSVALSLGLVGALSIVRFRAAIKEPEELVYLFLCVGVGLALGAGQPLLAFTILLVASVFVLTLHLSGQPQRSQNILLTISGDTDPYFASTESGVLAALEQTSVRYALQRYDTENGRGQVRVLLRDSNALVIGELISQLRDRLPECDFSFVNLNSSF